MKLLLLVPLAYAAIMVAIFIAQDRLLFPTSMVAGAAPLPTYAERLTIPAGADRLHGVHIRPSEPTGDDQPVILGFGGNAWNAEAVALYLHELHPDRHVVAFHYRGYSPSSGRPKAAALLADAPRIHDAVAERLGSDRIVAVGFSIGSGVAAHLARHRSLSGIVLVTPFDSLKAVARGHYPWLPVGLLFRNEMPAAEDLRASNVPTAIIAAQHDTIIPPARTDALRRAAPKLVFDRTIARAGHNDLYDRPEFRQAMREAIYSVSSDRLSGGEGSRQGE